MERLLIAIGDLGHSPAVRSLCEKRLSRVLRLLGPSRVSWQKGRPMVLALAAYANPRAVTRVPARAGDSMYGARRAAGYGRRVG